MGKWEKYATPVIVCTPTKVARFQFLLLALECLLRQTYRNIVEWVITDGTDYSTSTSSSSTPVPTLTTMITEHLFESRLKERGIKLTIITPASPTVKEPLVSDVRDISDKVYRDWNVDCVAYGGEAPFLEPSSSVNTTSQDIVLTVGAQRNRYNDYIVETTGSMTESPIIVCFDDDDFYQPTRVTHAVQSLCSHRKKLAASSAVYMYDSDLGRVYLFHKRHDKHGTNNTFAYRRDYLLDHRYDEKVWHAEEASFTTPSSSVDSNGNQIIAAHTEDMIQLDPKLTILQFAHTQNTWNKRDTIFKAYYPRPESKDGKPIFGQVDDVGGIDMLYKMIGDPQLAEKYMDACGRTTTSVYDIVYYCGLDSFPWDPEEKGLGGSEQAVIYLTKEWVKMGFKVAVYAALKTPESGIRDRPIKTVHGVDYFRAEEFKVNRQYQTLILWRAHGINPLAYLHLRAKTILLDVHDSFLPMNQVAALQRNPAFTKIMTKSKFHREVCLAYARDYTNAPVTTKKYPIELSVYPSPVPFAPSSSSPSSSSFSPSPSSTVPTIPGLEIVDLTEPKKVVEDTRVIKSPPLKDRREMSPLEFVADISVSLSNGVRIEEFLETQKSHASLVRNPYRLCYCSDYARGLEPLLTWLWPVLKRLEPRAELHVYYGMDYIRNQEFKTKMTQLLAQDGVTDHGRRPSSEVALEKMMSTYHLYFTATQSETDCISIRESVVMGCIPILSTMWVFAERAGLHIDLDPSVQMSHLQLAKLISEHMKNPDTIVNLQKQLEPFQHHELENGTWTAIAKKWIQHFD